ncbi:MAG: AHH domain-containing protein [Deltaproteobacteria bacterium]|nr:AHH domain-containing protein [Deltaproteobacteria bacterium]
MTNIGEKVEIADLLDLDFQCPFDHELEEPPEVKNNLVGIGSTLARKMSKGDSTKLYKDYEPQSDKEKIKWGQIAQKNRKHDCFKGSNPISVEFKFDNLTESKDYPLTFSAHHLIPSQESLKDHNILDYMCKKGETKEHNHNYPDGAVWSDVGYDTNGSENGIYLPGSYAVGGGKGGLGIWFSVDTDKDEEHGNDYVEYSKLPSDDEEKWLLKGKKGVIKEDNPCWQYVGQAMIKSKNQFHDRHRSYSKDIVEEALNAIYERYKLFDVTIDGIFCKRCKEKKEKIEKQGLPAPYSIVLRLEHLSNNLRIYLKVRHGQIMKENIFTSQWGEKYMQAKLKGEKAANMFR